MDSRDIHETDAKTLKRYRADYVSFNAEPRSFFANDQGWIYTDSSGKARYDWDDLIGVAYKQRAITLMAAFGHASKGFFHSKRYFPFCRDIGRFACKVPDICCNSKEHGRYVLCPGRFASWHIDATAVPIAHILTPGVRRDKKRKEGNRNHWKAVSSHLARLVYFFGAYPCHIYSNARGRVCAFTARSQWPAFFAKTNW